MYSIRPQSLFPARKRGKRKRHRGTAKFDYDSRTAGIPPRKCVECVLAAPHQREQEGEEEKKRKEGQRPDFSLFGAISVSDAVTRLRALHYLQHLYP